MGGCVIGESNGFILHQNIRGHLLVQMYSNDKYGFTGKGWSSSNGYGKEDLYNSPSHKSDKCNGSEFRFRPSESASSKITRAALGPIIDVSQPSFFEPDYCGRKVRTPTQKFSTFKINQAPSAKELPELRYFRRHQANDHGEHSSKNSNQSSRNQPFSEYFGNDASSNLSIDFRNSGQSERNQIQHNFNQNTDRMPRGSDYLNEQHFRRTQDREDKATVHYKPPKTNEDLFKKSSYNLKETTSTHSTAKLTHKRSDQLPSKAYRFRQQTPSNKLKISDFRIEKCMGKGKFGSVYMVQHIVTGFLAALKIISKKQIIQQHLLTQLIREIKIHAYLDHPNIIDFYGFFEDKENVYILLELGSEGQLYTKLKQKETYSEEATSFIIKSLLEAVQYMHNKRLLHRDIKPENIVIVHGTVKLCDFGWAVDRGNDLRTTMCGTPLYSSPEILMGKPYGEHNDLWAIGILTYQLVMGYIPFDITQQEQLIKIITDEIEFPKTIELSEDYKDFVLKILQKNPKDRLKCEDLLRHPFIDQYRQLQTCEQLC